MIYFLIVSIMLNILLFILLIIKKEHRDIFKRTIKLFLGIFLNLFSWYIILLSISSVYCYKNWEEVIKFSPFSGHSLIFIVLISLLLLPFFDKIEAFGISGIITSWRRKNKLADLEENVQMKLKDLEKNVEGVNNEK